MRRIVTMLSTMALCAAFLAAHFAAAMHEFEHDLDALDGKVCATCISVAQLGAACVDSHDPTPLKPAVVVIDPACISTFSTTHVVAVRQRGPPAQA